jgi:hypothetical protein
MEKPMETYWFWENGHKKFDLCMCDKREGLQNNGMKVALLFF